jgi:hypothetical protein
VLSASKRYGVFNTVNISVNRMGGQETQLFQGVVERFDPSNFFCDLGIVAC